MKKETWKRAKQVITDVYRGFSSCSTGGCCGVSLPKEDQDALKKWKKTAAGKQ